MSDLALISKHRVKRPQNIMTLDRSVNHLKDQKHGKNQLCAGGIQPFMKPDYKVILSTVLKLDKARWDLGDALVAECGPPDPTSASYDGPGRLRAAWHYLQENGYDCSLEDLSKLRRVSYVFGPSTRRFDISWDLYAEAGTPEMLEAIIRDIPKGTPLTKSYIASIRKQWKRPQREEAKD